MKKTAKKSIKPKASVANAPPLKFPPSPPKGRVPLPVTAKNRVKPKATAPSVCPACKSKALMGSTCSKCGYSV